MENKYLFSTVYSIPAGIKLSAFVLKIKHEPQLDILPK